MNPFESVLQKAQGVASNIGSKASAVGKVLTNKVNKFLTPKPKPKTAQTDPYGLSDISNIPKHTNNQRQQLDEINRLTK